MTLAQLLGINQRLLDSDEEEGLRLAEQVFAQAGAPIDRRALYVVLEKIISQIHRKRDRGASIRYPRFLYGKFKDLKRGLWEPRAEAYIQIEQMEHAAVVTASNEATPEGALAMIADLKRHRAPAEEIARWEQEYEKRKAAAQPGPQLVREKKSA